MEDTKIQKQISKLKGDEKSILSELLERLEMGRRRYGPWNINDNRNHEQEALEEVLDALFYIAAKLVRLKRQ